MKNGFYLGYDARGMGEAEIRRQAALLIEEGFYRAGYRTLRLGQVWQENGEPSTRFNDPLALAEALRALGFLLDVTVDSRAKPDQANEWIEKLGAQMVTVISAENRAAAERVVSSLVHCKRLALCVGQKDIRWAAEFADVVELDVISGDADFFEITRNQLDSCRNGDVDISLSDVNLRAEALHAGGVYGVGNVPSRFDAYRNQAIFTQICMLGCPLVLTGNVSAYSRSFAELVTNANLIRLARLGSGKTVRYYDPWHILLGKPNGGNMKFMLILNRCHGDAPTDILPADLGWESYFSVREWPEDTLAGECLERFAVHVETSDHPETPCCRLYMIEKSDF